MRHLGPDRSGGGRGQTGTTGETLAGVRIAAHASGLHFSYHELALAGAARGDGIALGSTALVSDALQAGTLARPFELTLPPPFSCYAAARPDRRPEPKIEAPAIG